VTTMWARIENGTVAEITDIDPTGRFHPSLQWAECGSDVAPGWTYNGESFAAPEAPGVDHRAVIAAERYKHEISGITWQGYGIATDRESQDKIVQENRAIDRALRVDGKGWKCIDLATGVVVFRPTTNAEMVAIGDAVYDYVSACFAREEALLDEIAAGTYDPAMLETGWPA